MLPSGMLKMLLHFRHTRQHRRVRVWDRTHFYSRPDVVICSQQNYKRTSTQIYVNRRRPRVHRQQTRELVSAGKNSWSSERNWQGDWNELCLPNLVAQQNILHSIATASIWSAVWVLVTFLLLSRIMGAVLWNHLLVLTVPSQWLSVCNQGPCARSTNKVKGRQSPILISPALIPYTWLLYSLRNG